MEIARYYIPLHYKGTALNMPAEDELLKLYHGTRWNHIPGIIKEGLKPNVVSFQNLPTVSFSTEPEIARRFALQQIKPSVGTVLSTKVPKKEIYNLTAKQYADLMYCHIDPAIKTPKIPAGYKYIKFPELGEMQKYLTGRGGSRMITTMPGRTNWAGKPVVEATREKLRDLMWDNLNWLEEKEIASIKPYTKLGIRAQALGKYGLRGLLKGLGTTGQVLGSAPAMTLQMLLTPSVLEAPELTPEMQQQMGMSPEPDLSNIFRENIGTLQR